MTLSWLLSSAPRPPRWAEANLKQLDELAADGVEPERWSGDQIAATRTRATTTPSGIPRKAFQESRWGQARHVPEHCWETLRGIPGQTLDAAVLVAVSWPPLEVGGADAAVLSACLGRMDARSPLLPGAACESCLKYRHHLPGKFGVLGPFAASSLGPNERPPRKPRQGRQPPPLGASSPPPSSGWR